MDGLPPAGIAGTGLVSAIAALRSMGIGMIDNLGYCTTQSHRPGAAGGEGRGKQGNSCRGRIQTVLRLRFLRKM